MGEPGDLDDVVALVRRVAGWEAAQPTIEPLELGITNRNYRVVIDGSRYVVRIPGEHTEVLGIDRAGEAEAARRAAWLGVAPAVVAPLPGVGTLVTAFVDGGHAADDDEFQQPARLKRVVAAISRFHGSGPISARFPIHRVVEWHARDAAAHGVEPPSMYADLHESSAAIEKAFAHAPVPEVPCHNDLLPANILFDGDRVWLLDFEYAGMNDAFFDLANLSVNSHFTPASDERLLVEYFGRVTPSGWARLQLMKVMSELREGMWAVVQQAISTLAHVDFAAYADERLRSCARLADGPEFERCLVAARQPVDHDAP